MATSPCRINAREECDILEDWHSEELRRSAWYEHKVEDRYRGEAWTVGSYKTVETIPIVPFTLEHLFEEYADQWSDETAHLSSTSAIVSHPSYRAIVRLGWEVVPLLLRDLQVNKRNWFPALAEITGIRPFDPSEAGNSRRMTQAWIKWGQRKELIPTD